MVILCGLYGPFFNKNWSLFGPSFEKKWSILGPFNGLFPCGTKIGHTVSVCVCVCEAECVRLSWICLHKLITLYEQWVIAQKYPYLRCIS